MICRSCGKEIQEGAAFCPHCGAVSGSSTPSYFAGPEAPVGGGKKKGLIIGGVVASVAVVAILIVVMSGLFSNPKKQVEGAALKSAAAFIQAEKALNMPDVSQWQRDQHINQEIMLKLNSVNSALVGYDLSALSGLGLRMNTALSGEDRRLGVSLAAFWGGDDLLSLQMQADDNELYLSSPQFTGGTAYGVNTETLGKDLEALGAQDVREISFNLFDLVEMALEKTDQERMKQSFQEANKALWEKAQVEKTGSKTMVVSKVNTKATVYQVTIPEEALDRYVDDLETALSALNYYELYREIFQSMGMPQEAVQDFLDELEGVDPYGQLADSLREAVDEIGDLTLNVFLSGGYVSSVQYEGYLFDDDTFVKISVFLGGGEEYVDDLRLELKVDDQLITVDSTGDHGGKSGVFTDKTTIKGPFPMVTSDWQYDPKAASGNLQWELGIDGVGTLEMAGQLTMEKESLDLQLDSASLRMMGMEICSFGMDYHVGPYEGPETEVANPKMIGQMDSLELVRAYVEVGANIQTWAQDMDRLFAARLPRELYNALF